LIVEDEVRMLEQLKHADLVFHDQIPHRNETSRASGETRQLRQMSLLKLQHNFCIAAAQSA
jgi:hypothetical protein